MLSTEPRGTAGGPATCSPERIFLGWDGPALPRAAALLAEHYAGAEELRCAEAVVVLPGSRAMRRLKELLLAEAERRELRLVPPRLVTVGRLPELFYQPPLPVADEVLVRRAWASALASLPAAQAALVFPLLPEPGDLRGWQRVGLEVERLHAEVAAGGLDFRAVAARCGEGLLFDDAERWLVLAEALEIFRNQLALLGRIDRESARLAALAAGELECAQEIWLVGVAEMPNLMRRFLEASGARLRALIHAPEALVERFDPLGCVREAAWRDAEVPIREETLALCAAPADQAQEGLEFLVTLGGRYAAEEISFGVPDEELVPFVEQRLGGAGLPVRYAAGLALERTAPYRLLEAVADFLDGRRFAALAALVRHADLGEWLRREAHRETLPAVLRYTDACLRPLDEFFCDALPAMLPETGGWGARVPATIDALREALDDEALLGRFRGPRPLSAWPAEILDLVVRVYGSGPLSREHPRGRVVIEFAQRLREAAAHFANLPAALDVECDAATAIRLLLDAVAGAAVPPEADRAAIEMLGWLELHLDDAPVAVLTGFNEPAIPASVNADAFLPNALRAQLGLEDNARRYARDAYQLTALLHSRPAVRLIAGRRTATGDPLRPSRLMFAVHGPVLAERVRRFYGTAEAGQPPRAADPGPAAPRVSGFRLPPEREMSAPQPLERLRVTDFRAILENPYLFALQRLLGLEPLDDGAREMDGGGFGTLLHEVLAGFARSDAVDASDARVIGDCLEELLEHHIRERYSRLTMPGVRLQFEQARQRLRSFAVWQARRRADGWLVWRAESQPEQGAPFPVDDRPLLLTGRIDRIDYHPEQDLWQLLDYKTGDRASDPERTHRVGRAAERRWIDLQLPLYRHLLAALPARAGERPLPAIAPQRLSLGYILIPSDPRRIACLCADWSPAELAEADEVAREAVRLVRRNLFTFAEFRTRYLDERFSALLGHGVLVGDEDGSEGAA
jgi:ATP-dependent helicase/nuclease subunit B